MALRHLRGVVLILLALVGADAFAQTHLVFNTAGEIVGSYSSTVVNKVGSGAASWFATSDLPPGAFTRASGTFNAGATINNSRFVMSGTAVEAFTGSELASAVVAGARAGLIGAAVGGAAYLALQQAHVYFDQTRQSMMYAPDPVNTAIMGQWYFPDGISSGHGPASVMCEGARSVVESQHAAVWNTTPPYHAVLNGIHQSGNVAVCDIQKDDGSHSYNDNTNYSHTLQLFSPSGGDPAHNTCPNGVQFDNTTQCAQGITDGAANGYVGPQITPSNGPAVGGDLMSKGQGIPSSSPPTINLQPGVGPTTTTTNPDGSKSTSVQTTTADCTQNVCNLTVNNVTTTTNNAGNVTGVTTTTTVPAANPSNPSTPAEEDKTKPCGLPSTPACKIDETGTPAASTPLPHADAWDAPTSDRMNRLPDVINAATKDSSLPDGLLIPPLAACEPFTIPNVDRTIDACGAVEGTRSVLDYAYGIGALISILGMVARALSGT